MNLLEHYKSMSSLFSIVKHPEKDLFIIRYHHLGVDWSIEGALDARGIVLDAAGNVIARPYKKFFNYKELEDREDLPEDIRNLSEWDDSRYIVQEKSDGSFIMVFVHEDEFVFTSSKTFDGEHVEKARNLFNSQFTEHKRKLIKEELVRLNSSLIFEMIGPANIHVVEYEKDMLILHDIVPVDESLYSIDDGAKFAKEWSIPFVKTYNYDMKDLLKLQKEAEGIEGFVVKFKNGKMLKIKTEEYFENSKGVEFFFGRFFTKRKLRTITQLIFDDEFDDLIALASNHPRVLDNLNTVKNYYDTVYRELADLQGRWSESKFDGREPKDIALDESISKRDKSLIFLSRKEHYTWLSFLIADLQEQFLGREG